MEYLRSFSRQGPMTYAAWIGIYAVIAALAGLSLWPH